LLFEANFEECENLEVELKEVASFLEYEREVVA